MLLLLIVTSSFAQNFLYDVRATSHKPVTKEMTNVANTMSDLNPGYPSSWVKDYIGTEISATIGGQHVKATGFNDTLTTGQKNIIQSAGIGDDIIIDVGYRYFNPVTLNMDVRKMHFVMTVIPEVQAEFPGGYEVLKKYLSDNAIQELSQDYTGNLPPVTISFIVTETGDIANASVEKTSSNRAVDKLLLRAINRMPRWKPAENASGQKISQRFQFTVGADGC
jgi:TonB family protein